MTQRVQDELRSKIQYWDSGFVQIPNPRYKQQYQFASADTTNTNKYENHYMLILSSKLSANVTRNMPVIHAADALIKKSSRLI